MKWIAIFLCCLVFTGCSKDHTAEYKNLLIGDWQLVTKKCEGKDGITEFFVNNGYQFFANDTVENKAGFINRNEPETNYGYFSKFKIKEDSLIIYDRSVKRWSSLYIKKLTKDSLVLGGSECPVVYTKKQYPKNTSPDFDAIVVSMDGCSLPCRITNVLVQANGEMLYDLFKDKVYRQLTTKLTPKEFLQIQQRFKKADYIHQKPLYGNVTDDTAFVTVSIVKNNRIIKSFYCTNREIPSPDLAWAYEPVTYLPDVVKKRPKQNHNVFFFGDISFSTATGTLQLTRAESYYLAYQLTNAHMSAAPFKPLYTVNLQGVGKIITDGQHYTFIVKDKELNNIDLGYNFIKGNKLMNGFD